MKARRELFLLKRTPRYFQREDLLAIPLCLLWALGFFGWAWGAVSAVAGSTSGHGGLGPALSAIMSLPLTLAKHLITFVS